MIATIPLATVLKEIAGFLKNAYDHRNDLQQWEGNVKAASGDITALTIKSVSLEVTGFKFVVEIGGHEHTLQALPNVHEMLVKLDGQEEPDGRVVFAPKPAFPSHPLHFHLDFRPVSFNGGPVTFEFRFKG